MQRSPTVRLPQTYWPIRCLRLLRYPERRPVSGPGKCRRKRPGSSDAYLESGLVSLADSVLDMLVARALRGKPGGPTLLTSKCFGRSIQQYIEIFVTGTSVERWLYQSNGLAFPQGPLT